MSETTPIRYAICVLLHPEHQRVVGLVKRKGPAKLIGKVTFPGGKLEPGETPAEAAAREMFQETGVDIPVASWIPFGAEITDTYELHKFVAVSHKALHARTMEEEPVMVLDYAHQLVYAERQPDKYAPDFIPLLLAALATAGLPSTLREGVPAIV